VGKNIAFEKTFSKYWFYLFTDAKMSFTAKLNCLVNYAMGREKNKSIFF